MPQLASPTVSTVSINASFLGYLVNGTADCLTPEDLEAIGRFDAECRETAEALGASGFHLSPVGEESSRFGWCVYCGLGATLEDVDVVFMP